MDTVNQGLPIPADFYLELRDKISDIMFLGTGIKPAENESYYKPNHVYDTGRYRDDILKKLTKRELEILEHNFDILDELMFSFLETIHEALKNK
jgi:energy-converting hydrogenase A subunit M